MHIPDNYLSPATCAVMGAAMVPVWAIATRRATQEVEKARIPLLGIAAAFSFLIMMFHVPPPEGTTGYAVGGVVHPSATHEGDPTPRYGSCYHSLAIRRTERSG